MALIKCSECGKEISDNSDVCVHCGCPLHVSFTSSVKVFISFNKFVIIFILAMLPTYLLRASFLYNSFNDISNQSSITSQGNAMNLLLIFCYIVMVTVTHNRGKSLNKPYVTVFPVLSAIFDVFLLFIPLVPTVLNIMTIVFLKPVDNEELVSKPKPKDKINSHSREEWTLAECKEFNLKNNSENTSSDSNIFIKILMGFIIIFIVFCFFEELLNFYVNTSS